MQTEQKFQVGQRVRIVDASQYADGRCGTIGNDGYVTLVPGTTGEVIRLDSITQDPIFRPHGFPAIENCSVRGYIFDPSLLEIYDGPESPCRWFYFDFSGKKIFKDVSPQEFNSIQKVKTALVSS